MAVMRQPMEVTPCGSPSKRTKCYVYFWGVHMAKCGIGLAVRLTANGMFQVDAVTPNSPSQLCGFFKQGDLITAVDSVSVIGFTMDQFVDAVLGDPGTDITIAIQRQNRDDLSAAADRLSHTLKRGLPKSPKELAEIQAESERTAQVAALERRKQMSVTRPSVISGIPTDVGKQGFLFKRSSSKILGSYKWQKRFFFISGNALYYRNLTEESGPSQFKTSNLLSGLSGDKKIVFGSNTEVLNSPFDPTQFSIAGAQNDRDREFVFKATNAVERQDWIDALLRCSGEEQPASPTRQDSVSNDSSSEGGSSARLPSRRASLPSIGTATSSVQSSATVQFSQDRSAFVANFPKSSTAEFPGAIRPTAIQAPATAQAPAAAATVVRPMGGRLELNAKKVQIQKAIGDSESANALLSKFALPAGATAAWLYDPVSVGEGAALTTQLKNHARSLTCLSFSISHTELLQPLFAAIKPLNLLTHINIAGQVFTRGAIQLFATAIEDTLNLSHISLCSARLSDEILAVLLQSLSSHRHITFLKFCDNDITAEGFASILKAVPRITGLELDANPISSKFISALPGIQQGLRDAAALSSMSLLQTGISVNEVDQLIQSFMQMDALEHLALDPHPRDLFHAIIKKSSGSAQFRFPPSCFVESGWPQCFWYLRHSNRHGHATKRNISICFLGPPCSGKTSLINALFGSASAAAAAVDTSCPTVGFRRYSVPFDNPNVLAQVRTAAAKSQVEPKFDKFSIQAIDVGSQGDNAACLHPLLTCRYSLYVIVWKRPDTVDPLSEQQLLPLISWVRATAAMNPAATFLIVATHSNTPRPGESLSAYKTAFESMLKAVDSRIKAELLRIQESFNAELAELQRTIEKLKAQLVAQEIRKRKLGSPCPGTAVLDIPGIPDEVRACSAFISELRCRIDDLSARSFRITHCFTAQGISNSPLNFHILPSLEFDCSAQLDLNVAKDAFNATLTAFVSNAHWKFESSVQFHDAVSDVIARLPAHKYSLQECVTECHLRMNQAADSYVAHSLQGVSSANVSAMPEILQAVVDSPSRVCGVQCEIQQPSGELKIFLVDCNNVTFSTYVSSKHPFVHDYLDDDPALLVPFIRGETGLGGAPSLSQVDVSFSNGSWTIAVIRPLKLSFRLSMERSSNARLPPTKLTPKDVRNIIKALLSYNVFLSLGETIFPTLKGFEPLFSLLVHPQPRRLAAAATDLTSSEADFKALEDVGIIRMQLFQHIVGFNTSASANINIQPALDVAMALSLIRKLPARSESEIRFKSAVRHMSTAAPVVPDSALAASCFAAALPFPFQVSVAAVLSHLVFVRIISNIEIDSGVVVTSGRGRILLQRGPYFCIMDALASDALPPPPDKFSSFGSYISKDMYPCLARVQSNDLSMFSYVVESLRITIVNGPLPFIFHPFCVKVKESSASASWIRQSIENPFFGISVKQWAECNSVGDRLVNLHAQRCPFYVSCQPNDTSRKFVAALKDCMVDRFLCNVWDAHNSTQDSATALAEARHFIVALTPEYLCSAACVQELLHILDLVHPSPDDPRPPVAAHARAIAANPALRKTISLLLLHPSVSSARIGSIAQSRLVIVPSAVGVAEVVKVTDAANTALLRLVSLARDRQDAFKKFDWFAPSINPSITGAAPPPIDAMSALVRSLFAAVPPQVFPLVQPPPEPADSCNSVFQHACLPSEDIVNLLQNTSAFVPAASPDAALQPGGFLQLYPESCSVMDAVSVAKLALLGLTDREICDAAGSAEKGLLSDFVGDASTPKSVEISELVRVIIAASGVDISSSRAVVAAARNPPTPPEAADPARERRESIMSNTSEGSNQDFQLSSDVARQIDGRSSPASQPATLARASPVDWSAMAAPASTIAPPPAPAMQRRRGSIVDI